jgi:hypothetical protein
MELVPVSPILIPKKLISDEYKPFTFEQRKRVLKSMKSRKLIYHSSVEKMKSIVFDYAFGYPATKKLRVRDFENIQELMHCLCKNYPIPIIFTVSCEESSEETLTLIEKTDFHHVMKLVQNILKTIQSNYLKRGNIIYLYCDYPINLVLSELFEMGIRLKFFRFIREANKIYFKIVDSFTSVF